MHDFENKIFELISVTSKVQNCSKQLGSCGILAASEARVIGTIGAKNKLMVGEIAEKLQMTKSAASQVIDKLVQKKLIKRSYDDSDRRIVYNSLTQKGEEAYLKYKDCRARLVDFFSQELKNQDKSLFIANVDHIINSCNKFLNNTSQSARN